MQEHNKTPPLWLQLQATAHVVMQIRSGVSGTGALEQVEAQLRPGIQALVFAALRAMGRAEVLRSLLAPRKPAPLADALLCTTLALSWREEDALYEPFTLVNQAVEAAKRTPQTRNQANFINACLRRFLRERTALVAKSSEQALALWNHPVWWIDRLKADYPENWQKILQANNQQAAMTLRVNARQSNVANYIQTLASSGITAKPNGEHGVRLLQALPVQAIPGFMEGVVSVQDAAAQLAAPLLLSQQPVKTGMRVLDACAAPGGKTAHLLEISDAHVLALDIDPQRCDKIKQTLQRLKLHADVCVADAAQPALWWDGLAFDAILLDAPCTASGIVRRHPDVRWLRRPTDVVTLVATQALLLKTLWPLLKPGGVLLYCTCSVFKDEGETQIKTFLANNTDARLKPSPGHLMPYFEDKHAPLQDNQACDYDGFYYALVEKNSV